MSFISIASYGYTYYIIRSILFGAIKRNPVAHLKSTNEIRNHSKFLLHAAYEELNLIQIVTYIHPLQMMIKTLRAQMGSKKLTRVPLMKLHLQALLKKRFPVMLAALKIQLYFTRLSKYPCKKKHRPNNFQAICKIHVSGPVRMHS